MTQNHNEESHSQSGSDPIEPPSAKRIIATLPSEIKAGLRSADFRTRRATWILIVSFVLLLVTIGFYGWHRQRLSARNQVRIAKQAVLEARVREIQEEEERRRMPPTFQSLGTFILQLKTDSGGGMGSRALNTAEFEVVAVCDIAKLCEWYAANLDLTRGSLTGLMLPMAREQLASAKGKRGLRNEIRDNLNRLKTEQGIHDGEVIDVAFPQFILN